ncbi:PAS domain-containing protein [Kitasatospora arboriphila]
METRETDPRVRLWGPVCQAVALLLGPYAEVVLHDAERDRVLAIWNPHAGRAPGDPSLLGELDRLEPAAQDVFGPYEKLLADGRGSPR